MCLLETTGPIDWTPGTPGSDKNIYVCRLAQIVGQPDCIRTYFLWERILTFRHKKYHIWTFHNKKYHIWTFHNKKYHILTFYDKSLSLTLPYSPMQTANNDVMLNCKINSTNGLWRYFFQVHRKFSCLFIFATKRAVYVLESFAPNMVKYDS